MLVIGPESDRRLQSYDWTFSGLFFVRVRVFEQSCRHLSEAYSDYLQYYKDKHVKWLILIILIQCNVLLWNPGLHMHHPPKDCCRPRKTPQGDGMSCSGPEESELKMGTSQTMEDSPWINFGSEPLRHGYSTCKGVQLCLSGGSWHLIVWVLWVAKSELIFHTRSSLPMDAWLD